MIVLIASLLPPAILLYIIYQQDKIEKEPPKLLATIFLFGALSTIAASILETIGGSIMMRTGLPESSYLYQLIMNFIVIACSEEYVKYRAMRMKTWNNPEFNYRFDGVVYGVFAALGFAAAENLLYVMGFGLGIAPLRAVTAIPLHCIAGVFMGHHYGMVKYLESRGDTQGAGRHRTLSFLIPVLIHGFYDFAASYDSDFLSLAFFVFVIVIDIIAIRSVKAYSRTDDYIY